MKRPAPALHLLAAAARTLAARAEPRAAPQAQPADERCCSSAAPEDAAAPASRRRKLWELNPRAHCPVLGVCLPIEAQRRLARKVLGQEPAADGYELHTGMVTICRRKGPMAMAVQRELDRRFLPALRRAATVDSADGLAAWWQAESATPALPGALWATLTHPRLTPKLEAAVLGQVHMLQHQLGMATRAELSRFEALIDENAILARALAAAQQRCTRQAAEHMQQTASLQAELVQRGGQLHAAETALAALQAEMQQLHAAAPQPPRQQRLVQYQAQLSERCARLERELQTARAEIQRLLRPGAAAAIPTAAPSPEAGTASLEQRNVLCVGGRTSAVPVYRRLVEARGACFLHHDGGEEDKLGLLDATLAAADLVICQTGCVSHNAYWRVKDHCKRTGKRCVFAETPSAASLQRALAVISGD